MIDPEPLMDDRPYQIENVLNDDGSITQTLYAIPKKYIRTFNKNTWSPFTEENMLTSLIMTDRISEQRTPAIQNYTLPIFDKFANVGLYSDIRRTIANDRINDGTFFSDSLTRIL